jgi:ATP:corrinoid adenosyltransferase
MHEREPSAMDYIFCLSVEVTGLLEVFVGVNKNFASAAVEGTLIMAGNSIDLAALQTMATDSGSNILPVERDVRKATHAVSK